MEQLFDTPAQSTDPSQAKKEAPLAVRMRPRKLDDFVGQDHIFAAGSALRAALEAGQPPAMILHGPPGCGKTTLARLAAIHVDAAYEELSAVHAGRAEVRALIERARERQTSGRNTVFFLDEIHRFNKAQQDQLLQAVEEGLITLIGATTENPYYEVNSALISRTQVYELQPLTTAEIKTLLTRALGTSEFRRAVANDQVLEFLSQRADGDARRAFNALELAHAAATRRADHEPSDTEGNGEHTQPTQQQITITDIEDALQRKALLYDKNSDQHYDYISAWIKSTRGSDPDASLYYLAAMLEGGENPRFIARRMVILASEDIGNADPAALPLAVSAAQAVEHVGLPECQFALAQAAIYLSLAPKSNSATQAITKARQHIRNEGAKRAPDQLRHQTPPQARDQANQASYDSPHKHPGHINQQEHLPRGRENLRFYDPDTAEQKLSERLQQVRAHRRKTTP